MTGHPYRIILNPAALGDRCKVARDLLKKRYRAVKVLMRIHPDRGRFVLEVHTSDPRESGSDRAVAEIQTELLAALAQIVLPVAPEEPEALRRFLRQNRRANYWPT